MNGLNFAEPIAKSRLQNSSYAPLIWLVFDEIQNRAVQNRFLEMPLVAPKTTSGIIA